jgi:hypothetical protein
MGGFKEWWMGGLGFKEWVDGGEYRFWFIYEDYEVKRKAIFMMPFTFPENFFFIFMMSLHGEKKTVHYSLLTL